MSSTDDSGSDKLAGHAPAVKMAGGVRITQNKPPREEAKSPPKDEEEVEPERPNPNDQHQILISGAPVKGDRDFPPEAVKAFHEKPQPTVQQNHVPQQRHNIQQPRKQ